MSKLYRIFLVIGGKASAGDESGMWIKNFYDPLIALGHDVFLLDTDEFAKEHGANYMSIEAKEVLSNQLEALFLKEHHQRPFDLFISYLHNGQVYPDVLKQINRHICTINYSTNFHQFEMYREVALNVDYNIYISKPAKDSFDELGLNSYWMPLAANPEFYRPTKNKSSCCVFVGSSYGPRARLFWRLLQYGIDLHLYGNGWVSESNRSESGQSIKHFVKKCFNKFTGYEITKTSIQSKSASVEDLLRKSYEDLNFNILQLMRANFKPHLHGTLNDKEYIEALASADSVINIQESRFNHDYLDHRVLFGSNLRDFETTMCGTALFTQHSDEIQELFDVDQEVVCYHNEHDLASKLKFYHSKPDLKRKIALAGHNRSIKDHTWQKRFTDFFSYYKF